jgi:hypothetical protein
LSPDVFALSIPGFTSSSKANSLKQKNKYPFVVCLCQITEKKICLGRVEKYYRGLVSSEWIIKDLK